jgi:glycosyltransferase involved in cell wall biosynthesis
MNQELVSVIMPTFNAGRYLSASIESILGQTYQNLELLISDDGSTDDRTLRLLKEYADKDPRVKVDYLEGNCGPGVARNNSIKKAQGRYIAFCDSDDRWFPEKLEKQIALMEAKDCALTCTSYITCDANDEETGIVVAPERITFKMMKHDNKVGCLTAVYDTKRLGQKFLMPELRKRQDWALFISILKKSEPAYALTEPLAYYRQRLNSVSSNKFSLIKYNVKVYETVLGFPKWKALTYFLFVFLPTYYTKVLKRKIDSWKYLASRHH